MLIPNKQEEKKHKRSEQSTYFAELSYLNSTKKREIENESEIKAEEREVMDNKTQIMENQQKELNAEDQKFKKAMGQNYIREMAEKRRKKIEEKLRGINEDNANLQRYIKAAEEEQFRSTLSKINLK